METPPIPAKSLTPEARTARRVLLANIRERLAEARARRERSDYARALELIMAHGRFFEPSPHKPPAGKRAFCSYNVGRAVAAGLPPGWAVAVGYWSQGSGHVWLVDEAGLAVDSTAAAAHASWRDEALLSPRFGVAVPVEVAARFLRPVDDVGAKETGSRWQIDDDKALIAAFARVRPRAGPAAAAQG